MKFSKANNSGFTLLEVMVAVALLAIFLVPLLITHRDTVRNIRVTRELTMACLLAHFRIGMLETLGFESLGEEGFLEAGADEEAEKYPYLTIEEEVTLLDDLLLAQADISVFLRSGSKARAKDKDKEARNGVKAVSYIASLYFEEEEGEEGGMPISE